MLTRFGLMLLGVVAGCAGGDDGTASSAETGTSSTSTSPTSTSAPTSSSTSTGGPTDSSSSSSSSTTDDTTTTPEPTSTTNGSSTTAENESTTTGNGAMACMAGCQVEVDCGFCGTEWKSVEACVDWCTANLEKAGAFTLACRSAWAGMHECVGELTCEEFTSWCAKDPPFRYPCLGADEELSFECKGQ